MTPEKKFENSLVRELKMLGVFAHHFDAIGCDGWPDLVVLHRDRCLLIECKHRTSILRKEQVAFRSELAARYGFTRYVVVNGHDSVTTEFWPLDGDAVSVENSASVREFAAKVKTYLSRPV